MSLAITEATITVEADVLTDDGPGCGPQILGRFTALDGSPVEVRIRLFQLGDLIGVGVYPTDRNGTVLRWDDGPEADPQVIYWSEPHCPDDQCGSPCGHAA